MSNIFNVFCKLIFTVFYSWNNIDLYGSRYFFLERALEATVGNKEYRLGFRNGYETYSGKGSHYIYNVLSFYESGVCTQYERGLVDGLSKAFTEALVRERETGVSNDHSSL